MEPNQDIIENPEKKKRVLLIEDDSFISQLYALKFSKTPYEMILARDGEEGIALSKDQKPDLILLDIILPKLSGFSVLESFKSDPETKDIPVILLTNLGQQENIQRGMNLGAADYIIKAHHTPQEVINKIEPFLK